MPRPLSHAALVIVMSVAVVQAQSPAGTPPPWAYTVNPPPAPGAKSASAGEPSSQLRRDLAEAASGREGGPSPPDPSPQQVPGSSVSLTIAQTRDAYNPPDWHPDAHPPMPPSVAHGRPKEMRACGFCHLVNGQGRPENASLAGLPAAYIVQQMADFKSGDRRSAEPRMGPPNAMIQDAKAATDDDVRQAAAYFSSFAFRKWIRVVETKEVPKTRIAGSMHVPAEGGTEPLGRRIIEMPEDLRRTELRDAASGFVAYVPEGSVARGETLVKTGGTTTVACGTCHGADLKGLGPIPPLAGRSPSYTVRQLYDLQQGVRKGPWSPLMKAAVEKLTIDDMIAIAAYAASREP
jgi:cytochrome c553